MSDIRITGFEMIEKLGEGGMASVWKARQISLDRIVAIKILSPRLVTDSSDVQRFQTEAQSAAKLKHPGIVQVYDANVENGLYYFVMEYVAGYTVGDWIRRKKVLPEKDALLVAECVSDALDYAWRKEHIIHCDIKPDNVIIDSDGTVKLADLGLARTISSMSTESVSDEIMGTPAYISPEQATGEPDMDFRVDIYSLGAMLYHLVTGKMLFEGSPENRVMEMQVNAKVDDPLDINPRLSKAVCWLIEKMLAKDRDARQKDWKSVRDDIARVKRRLMPHGPLPIDGASTVKRSTRRSKADYVHSSRPKTTVETGPPLRKLIIAAGIIGMVVLGIYRLSLFNKPPDFSAPYPLQPPLQPIPSVSSQEQQADKDAMKMYEFAKKWIADNPGRYDEAVERLRTVAEQTKDTVYSLMAEDEIGILIRTRQKEVEKVMTGLEKKTAYFIKGEEFVHAANVYGKYNGKLAAETKVERAAIAEQLHERQAGMEEARRNKKILAEKKMESILDKVVSELIAAGPVQALSILGRALADDALSDRKSELQAVRKVLYDAAGINNRILDSFKAQKGVEIIVHLADGKKKIIIDDVKGGRVFGRRKLNVGEAVVSISFGVDDLDRRERLLRMGPDELPDVALVKGLIALNSKAYSYAKKYFEKTHPLLADRLLARVQNDEQE